MIDAERERSLDNRHEVLLTLGRHLVHARDRAAPGLLHAHSSARDDRHLQLRFAEAHFRAAEIRELGEPTPELVGPPGLIRTPHWNH